MGGYAFLAQPYIPPSPVQTLGQLYALQNQRQEMQARSQEMSLRDLQMQADQNQLDDQRGLAKAYQAAVKPSPDGGAPQFDQGALEDNVRQFAPRQYPAAVKAGMDRQKEVFGLQAAQLAQMKSHIDLVGQLAGGITDQRSYDAAVQHATGAGLLQPGEAPPVYDPKVVAGWQASAMSAADRLKAVQAQLNLAETSRHNDATEQQAANDLGQTQTRDANTARYQRGELGLRGQELGLQGKRLNLEYGLNTTGPDDGTSGESWLAKQALVPAVKNQVRQVAAGELPMPAQRWLQNAVMAYRPDYSSSVYDTQQSAKSGDLATQLKGAATMADHLERTQQNSNDWGYYNALRPAVKAAYTKDIQFYTGELGKLVEGKAITEGDAARYLSGLDSPLKAVRDQTLDEMRELGKGRFASILQQYKAGTGRDLDPQKFFDADTRKRLQGYGYISGSQGAGNDFATKPSGVLANQAVHPAPRGARMQVPGSDGKMHWSDGKKDLGVVE